MAASLCLDEYFCGKYPDCPMMKTKVTRKNMAENVRQAFDYFAGRKTQTATLMLQSFGVLDGDKIRPEGSKYAAYYIDDALLACIRCAFPVPSMQLTTLTS